MGFRMKTVSTITCIFLLLTAASQAGPPDWFVSGQHPSYQTEFYFVGVGSGDSYDAAIEQASAQISRQIEIKVESESVGFIGSYTENDQELIRSQYESITKSFSEASLKGAEVSEKATAGNVYYVLLTIDKDKYAAGLRTELDQMRSEIQQQYDDAEALIDEGQILQAFRTLIETSDAAADFHARAVLYTSISSIPYLTEDIISGPTVLTKIRKLISKIKLERLSGDKQTAQNGKLLSEPFVVKVSLRQHGGAIPVKNLRLALKDEDNKVIERQYTDDRGEARFWVYAVGEDKGKIAAGIDLLRIPSVLKRDFRDTQTTFNYNIISVPSMTFSVQVRDEKGKRLDTVENIVAKSVQDAGHHVSDDAPFLLSGTVTIDDTHQIDGLDGPQHLVKTELTLFIMEKQSGEKVGSVTLTGKGMHKESEQKALDKSYNKLKISRKDLTRALSAAADKLKPIQEKLSKDALTRGKACYEKSKYQDALGELSRVSVGDKYVEEAEKLIEEIKLKLIERQKSIIHKDKVIKDE